MGYRLTGSSDLYENDGRRPYMSINFITAHDGFTMRDLVSYNCKHNEANLEGNRDGNNDNCSWNHGVEGETDNKEIKELRNRQMRNFMATLMFSQGTPMICGGDEISRTQKGNNNAYCQDNEISWFNWNLDEESKTMLEFTKKVIQIRKSHPALHRTKFFQGRLIRGTSIRDIVWYKSNGCEMDDATWNSHSTRSLGMFLAGSGVDDVDENGIPLHDDNLLIMLNASEHDENFVLPNFGTQWELVISTSDPKNNNIELIKAGKSTLLKARSLKLFRQYQ